MNRALRPPAILVVDDDQALCAVLSEILGDAGYAVQCAYDGEAAWTEIQVHSPDLVLSDITMPRLDGVSLARRLADSDSRIPIVLMSAKPNDGAAMGRAFIRKPFEMDILLACFARTLDGTDPARAPVPH